MDSRQIIAETVTYINAHLTEQLTAQELAKKAGFSTYYYCKLFTLYMGIPVMEYIRRQRLAYAAYDICDGKRIIDVALDYGFESHGGFAKAFKKNYGFSPEEFRARTAKHRPPSPNPLENSVLNEDIVVPNVRIEERKAFYIAGIVLKTSSDISSISQFPALWNTVSVREAENRIYALACPIEHGEYYISFPINNEFFRLVTGVKITNPDIASDQLYVDCIPAGLYAVFSPQPVFGDCHTFSETIKNTWKYIFEKWLPSSEYILDPDGLDYEFYDERCHKDGPYTMDICVPVKKKGE